uniref:Uncharacterized protein n=1 Tax=Romanomermis culicivorax TaxID=13658 RepID=A0A915J348_ROMCU
MFNLSAENGTPPNDATVSTKNRHPLAWHKSPSPSKGCMTPVDDSLWHMKKTTGYNKFMFSKNACIAEQ